MTTITDIVNALDGYEKIDKIRNIRQLLSVQNEQNTYYNCPIWLAQTVIDHPEMFGVMDGESQVLYSMRLGAMLIPHCYRASTITTTLYQHLALVILYNLQVDIHTQIDIWLKENDDVISN